MLILRRSFFLPLGIRELAENDAVLYDHNRAYCRYGFLKIDAPGCNNLVYRIYVKRFPLGELAL